MIRSFTAAFVGLIFSVAVASAQGLPPPPPGGGGGGGGGGQQGGGGGHHHHGSSLIAGQAISIGCWAVVAIVHSQVMPALYDREPTPIEINTDGMMCGSLPAMLIGLATAAQGIHDNACSYAVARRALKQTNSPEAKQERLWMDDGSWARRVAKINNEYYDCYHGVTHLSAKKIRHHRSLRHRRQHR
jgi:hypothetical protein